MAVLFYQLEEYIELRVVGIMFQAVAKSKLCKQF